MRCLFVVLRLFLLHLRPVDSPTPVLAPQSDLLPSGGILHWADSIGAKEIHARLLSLRSIFKGTNDFFTPCAYLEDCARTNRKLSAYQKSMRSRL